MFDNPFSMVVAIVLIVMIGNVLKARYKSQRGNGVDERSNARIATDNADAARLRDEVRGLKERVQVLERVITDQRQTSDLDIEIEKLRGR